MSLLWCVISIAQAQPSRTSRDFEAECEQRLKPTEILILAVPMEPSVDTRYSYVDLTRRAGQEGYLFVLGLTSPYLRVETQWGYNGLAAADRRKVCMRPILRMTLRYDPVTVYVGREFAEDDCAFKFIMQHEMRHVDVHVQKLKSTVATLQSAIQQRFGTGIFYGTREGLEKRFRTEIENYWVPRAQRELKDVRRLHEQIDTAEEYARSQTACEGRIAHFLSRQAKWLCAKQRQIRQQCQAG